jgi:hypothetical protein
VDWAEKSSSPLETMPTVVEALSSLTAVLAEVGMTLLRENELLSDIPGTYLERERHRHTDFQVQTMNVGISSRAPDGAAGPA